MWEFIKKLLTANRKKQTIRKGYCLIWSLNIIIRRRAK